MENNRVQKPLKIFLKKYMKLIRKEKLVLDLGCGYGDDAINLVKTGFTVEAVDHSLSKIRYVRKIRLDQEIKNLTTCCMNIKDFYFNRSYGTMLILHVLHYLNPQERNLLIGKMKKHTIKKGVHFIAVFTSKGDLRATENIYFSNAEELKIYYADWNILLCEKKIMSIAQTNEQGQHQKNEVLFFIAQAP